MNRKRKYPKPNIPEKKLLKIIKTFNLPYRYTGDSSFWIGNINPDFVNTDGVKIALEVFGDYWHRDRENLRPSDSENAKRAILKEFGWDLIVIWESELNHLKSEEIVGKIMKDDKLCHFSGGQ